MTEPVTKPADPPTIDDPGAARAVLAALAVDHEWVSVFWDRGWGDSPLEISIITDGDGQNPHALITTDVYDALRDHGDIEPNSLRTFKKRKVHNYIDKRRGIGASRG